MDRLLGALQDGEAVLLATDTVFGVGAVPGSAGYEHIFELKQRSSSQVLPWLVAGAEALESLAVDVPAYARRLAGMFWPGALTLVVRASESAAATGCVADDGTVALRCPDDALCLELLAGLGGPIACTSANLHGEPAPAFAADISPAFLKLTHADDLADQCPVKTSSTIVDCTGKLPRVIRHGSINEQVIQAVAALDATLL